MGMTKGEGEKDEVEIEGEEDTEPARYLPSEPIPPAKEVEVHRCSHIPYRSWWVEASDYSIEEAQPSRR